MTAPDTNVAACVHWTMPKQAAIISNSVLAVFLINCLALNFAPDPLLILSNMSVVLNELEHTEIPYITTPLRQAENMARFLVFQSRGFACLRSTEKH